MHTVDPPSRSFARWLAPLLLLLSWLALVACDDDQSLPAADPDATDVLPDSAQDTGTAADGDTVSPNDTADTTEAPDTTAVPDVTDTLDTADGDTVEVLDEVDQFAPFFAPDRVLDIAIELPADDWDALRFETRDLRDILTSGCQDGPIPSPFTWYEGTITIDGERVERVGFRKKGLLGSLSETKPSLKVDFNRYISGQAFHALERMTLNNGRQDPSLVHTCLGYEVFRRAGYPASRCSMARVSVNGQDMGVYVHVQDVRKQMLREHFGDDEGALYEGTLSDFRPGWITTFERKTNEEVTDRTDLDAVAAALEAPDDQLLDALDAVVDLDAFFTFWALEVLIGHWDGYNGNNNNYFIYADPTDDRRFTFIPWGVDALFTPWRDRNHPSEIVAANNLLSQRLYAHPEGRARYLARLGELVDTVWDEAWLHSELDRLSSQALAGSDDEKDAEIEARVAEIAAFIDGRAAAVLAELDAAPDYDVPLPDRFCAMPSGAIDWSFETSWDTYAEPDVFSTGTGSVTTLQVNDQSFPIFNVGSKVGLDPNKPPERASLLMAVVVASDLVFVASVDIPVDQLVDDNALVLGRGGDAFLATFRPSTGEFALAGYLLDVNVELTTAAATDGAPVTGRIHGEVWTFGP